MNRIKAAEYSGVSRTTINRWIETKKLPYTLTEKGVIDVKAEDLDKCKKKLPRRFRRHILKKYIIKFRGKDWFYTGTTMSRDIHQAKVYSGKQAVTTALGKIKQRGKRSEEVLSKLIATSVKI